jgi:hypothetical protein
MSELDRAVVSPPEGGEFNFIDAAVGVVTRPVPAMRQIAAARPWLIGLALYIVIALLGGLAGLTAPAPATALPPDANVPPEFEQMLEGMMEASRSPLLIAAAAVVLSPISLLITSGIFYLVGRLLGGQGPFSALFATQAFASVPSLLLAALTAVLNLAGTLLAPLVGLLGFAVGIWILVLEIIGIRESLALSTGRAVATVLIPVGVVILLGCVLVALVVMAAVGAIGAAGGLGG